MLIVHCIAIFFSLTIQAAVHSEDKLIALNSGGERVFNCYGEIKIHQSDCLHEMIGQKIAVQSSKRCQMRFTCNSTVFTALCCKFRELGLPHRCNRWNGNSRWKKDGGSFDETGNTNNTLFTKEGDNFIKIKLDGTLKLLVLLLILLLMIILTGIVFCKIWCMKRMLSLEPKSYAILGDNLQVKKDNLMETVKNIEVKKIDNLINLNQEDQELDGTKEETAIVNFPLRV